MNKQRIGGKVLRDFEGTLDNIQWNSNVLDSGTNNPESNDDDKSIVGLASLWEIVLHATNDAISKQASETLLIVCSQGIHNTGGGGKDVIEFLEKIFSKYLNDNNRENKDIVTLRCLDLLSNFVTRSRETIVSERKIKLLCFFCW
jgi:hypothetical protein